MGPLTRDLSCGSPEWYAGHIQPWVHYVPIKIDYTDLYDVLAFFSGDMHGRNGHDALAKQIALQGKDFAARFWRYEDSEWSMTGTVADGAS